MPIDWRKWRCAASGAIGNAGHTAVRLDNRVHEGKAETVPRRMFSLHEALKSTVCDIRREPRAIVFDHQFCRPLVQMQPNTDPAALWQVGQFGGPLITEYETQGFARYISGFSRGTVAGA